MTGGMTGRKKCRTLRRLGVAAVVLMLCLAAAPAALAIDPNEALPNPQQEARARALFKQLRCVVCKNVSIDSSEADIARDLRSIVRERIQAGATNQEILHFLTKRYGDFILLRPPVRPATWPLWFGPFALLAAGAGGLYIVRRRRAKTAVSEAAPLAPDERDRLERMLAGDDGQGRT